MSIDKWLKEKEDKELKEKKEKVFKNLPDHEILDLKKEVIKKITKKDSKGIREESSSDDFFSLILEFKEWISSRKYLKGDLDKIESWIRILHKKISTDNRHIKSNNRLELKKKFRKIPPELLDQRTRIALNKKLQGVKRTSSDNYYLRKLRNFVEDKLKEAKYYTTIKEILDL
ncbi:MAG: hypothetical protein ACTSUX_11445 [Promethearchaeota archaeon]